MSSANDLNPMRRANHFKIGLFGYLHEGGNCFTTVPERWLARWPDIMRLAQMADQGGLDFMLPISRWKGVPGALMQRLHSYETLTQAAALGALTKRIAVLSTVHTPLVHPIIAAKCMTTVDHVSNGRSGLNIVCGWNTDDFEMFGRQTLPHGERYKQAWEWYQIWSRLIEGAEEPFDFDTKFFPGHKALVALPGSIQRPRPIVISAAASPDGREFAMKTSDLLFTYYTSFDAGKKLVADIKAQSAEAGRSEPVGLVSVSYIVCRKTRAEAEAYHRYYAEELADKPAIDYYMAGRSKNATMPQQEEREMRLRFAAGNGGYPLIGTPQDVADGLIEIARAGYAGTAISMVDYVGELPPIIEEVLPILHRAGIRAY